MCCGSNLGVGITDNAINGSLLDTLVPKLKKLLISTNIVRMKKEVEIKDLHWGILERENKWIERRSYVIREKNYFIMDLQD